MPTHTTTIRTIHRDPLSILCGVITGDDPLLGLDLPI